MPSRRFSTSLTANETVENDLRGEDFEFIRTPSLVSLSIAASTSDVEAEFSFDQNKTMPRSSVQVESASGRVVKDEDLVVDQEFAPAGSQLRLSLYEVGGAAADVQYLLTVEPIPQGAM